MCFAPRVMRALFHLFNQTNFAEMCQSRATCRVPCAAFAPDAKKPPDAPRTSATGQAMMLVRSPPSSPENVSAFDIILIAVDSVCVAQPARRRIDSDGTPVPSSPTPKLKSKGKRAQRSVPAPAKDRAVNARKPSAAEAGQSAQRKFGQPSPITRMDVTTPPVRRYGSRLSRNPASNLYSAAALSCHYAGSSLLGEHLT